MYTHTQRGRCYVLFYISELSLLFVTITYLFLYSVDCSQCTPTLQGIQNYFVMMLCITFFVISFLLSYQRTNILCFHNIYPFLIKKTNSKLPKDHLRTTHLVLNCRWVPISETMFKTLRDHFQNGSHFWTKNNKNKLHIYTAKCFILVMMQMAQNYKVIGRYLSC